MENSKINQLIWGKKKIYNSVIAIKQTETRVTKLGEDRERVRFNGEL